ncbi:MAG: YARHG domain-containing protein [Acidobacteria bacterium]|nr:YARHG domain-containing protein [Acidobacteriota bacterium]
MTVTPQKLKRTAAALAVVVLAAAACPAQGAKPTAEEEKKLKEVVDRVEALVRASGQNLNAFEKLERFDFAKQKVTREQLEDLDLWDLKKVRGIVFGRHGRVFTDRDIQGYLKEQAWYKPDPDFSNSRLNANERAGLDLIRELEAEKHDYIEPGDLRWWQSKPMTEEKLGTHSAGEWRILRAEVEAVRGKRFNDDPWLQQYFEERYWYKADPSYSARSLTPVERGNLAAIDAAQRKQRRAAVSPGDMEHFEKRPLTEEMLKGLSLHELRLLRNEVYARRGRQFRTEWLSQYFWSQPWYEAREDNSEPALSETEQKNIETIVAYERKVREGLSTTPVTNALLEGMFLEDARKLRNEIYARHGKVFKDRWLQGYFKSFDWYKPNPRYTDAALTAVERQNVAAIAAYEKKATSVLDAVEG